MLVQFGIVKDNLKQPQSPIINNSYRIRESLTEANEINIEKQHRYR
jgi:hypothetical protein